jgi:hypothetical protein
VWVYFECLSLIKVCEEHLNIRLRANSDYFERLNYRHGCLPIALTARPKCHLLPCGFSITPQLLSIHSILPRANPTGFQASAWLPARHGEANWSRSFWFERLVPTHYGKERTQTIGVLPSTSCGDRQYLRYRKHGLYK